MANQSPKSKVYANSIQCFQKIWKSEGVRGFYKGTLSAMIGYGPHNAFLFGTCELFKILISYFDNNDYKITPMSHHILSGTLSGTVSALTLVTFALLRLHPITLEFYSKKTTKNIPTDIKDLLTLE